MEGGEEALISTHLETDSFSNVFEVQTELVGGWLVPNSWHLEQFVFCVQHFCQEVTRTKSKL